MTVLNKILVAIFVLLLSAGIFYLIVQDKQVKSDILKTTLKLFGDELLAMMPSGEQKQILREKYQTFLDKAEQDEIPPEQIEKVASVILNLTKTDTVITAAEAIVAMESIGVDTNVFLPVKHQDEAAPAEMIIIADRSIPPPPPKHWSGAEREELATRLRELHEFRKKMYRVSREDSAFKQYIRHYHFKRDSALKVVVNPELKVLMDQKKAFKLESELNKLEESKLIEWRTRSRNIEETQKVITAALEQIPKELVPSILYDTGEILKLVGKSLIDSLAINNPDSLEKLIVERVKQIEQNRVRVLTQPPPKP